MTGGDFSVPDGLGGEPDDEEGVGAAIAPDSRTMLPADPAQMMDSAEQTALVMADHSEELAIYRYGNELVRLRSGTLVPLARDVLANLVARHVRFMGVRGERWVPDPVIVHLIDEPSWAAEVIALHRAPVLAASGAVVTQPGYSADTGLLLDLVDGDWLAVDVPQCPTRAETKRAAKMLGELLDDFPFADRASRANALALLLTPCARQLIGGIVPLFLITANAAGSGKTMLARLARYLLDGRETPTQPFKSDEAEMRKALFAAARAGGGPLLIDNVPNGASINSAELARITTSRELADRVLGHSTIATVPNGLTVVATGNNIGVEGDLHRRTVPIILDWSAAERPEDRTEFRFGSDVTLHVAQHRARYLSAALTVLRAWVVAGRPAPPARMRTLPAFGRWSHCIAGTLAMVGESALLANGDALRAHDPEAEARYSLLEVAGRLPAGGWPASRLRDALADLTDPDLPCRVLDWSTAKELGYLLRSLHGEVVRDPEGKRPPLRLTMGRQGHGGVRRWVVKTVDPASTGAP